MADDDNDGATAPDAPTRTHRDVPDSFDPAPATPPAVADADTGYTSTGVPTFESVREKIETRYGTAIGATELDSETEEARRVEQQYEARQKAAAERLEQIRESMKAKGDG